MQALTVSGSILIFIDLVRMSAMLCSDVAYIYYIYFFNG